MGICFGTTATVCNGRKKSVRIQSIIPAKSSSVIEKSRNVIKLLPTSVIKQVFTNNKIDDERIYSLPSSIYRYEMDQQGQQEFKNAARSHPNDQVVALQSQQQEVQIFLISVTEKSF